MTIHLLPKHISNIFQYIDEIGNVAFILCGDFTLTLASEIGCFNHKNTNSNERDRRLEYVGTFIILICYRPFS